MFTSIEAIALGIVQGATELFPVSSLGHSVILPGLFRWPIDQQSDSFVVFLVATHFATALVLFLFFIKDWQRILSGFFRSLRVRKINDSDHDAKLAWLLVVTTIPAGILGLLFQDKLQSLFAAPQITAFVLILNGILLLAAEGLRRRRAINHSRDTDIRISKLSWRKALTVGLIQCIALLPGFSRTGSTIAGGLLVGLSHEDAARFSFLLATPIIGAASLLKLPEVLAMDFQSEVKFMILGSVVAGVTAFFTVKFLTKYFKTNTLIPFAIYCLAFGTLASLVLLG